MKPLDFRLYTVEDIATEVANWGRSMTDEEVLCWLRAHGYLIATRGENYTRPSDLCLIFGFMEQRRTVSEGSGGRVFIETRPVFTKEGKEFILPRIIEDALADYEDLRD